MPLLIFCMRLVYIVGMSLCVVGVLGCWKMTRSLLTVGLNLTWWLLRLFVCCDPGLTVDGSGVISDPDRTGEQFRGALLPFFCRAGRGAVNFSASDREVGGWLPNLGEVDVLLFWGLICIMLCNITRLWQVGWMVDWLVVVLSRVELDGVWPDGLLDAYCTMIPKVDGDATLLGQRPLCVLPVVYRIWASVWLRHLDHWLKSLLPCSVFSAGGGRGSVEAWYSTAFLALAFDSVDRGVLDLVRGRLGLPVWFRTCLGVLLHFLVLLGLLTCIFGLLDKRRFPRNAFFLVPPGKLGMI